MSERLTPKEVEGIVFGAIDITPSGFVKAGAEAQLAKLSETTDEEIEGIMEGAELTPNHYTALNKHRHLTKHGATFFLSQILQVFKAREAKKEIELGLKHAKEIQAERDIASKAVEEAKKEERERIILWVDGHYRNYLGWVTGGFPALNTAEMWQALKESN